MVKPPAFIGDEPSASSPPEQATEQAVKSQSDRAFRVGRAMRSFYTMHP
jgi:hypothetical protein